MLDQPAQGAQDGPARLRRHPRCLHPNCNRGARRCRKGDCRRGGRAEGGGAADRTRAVHRFHVRSRRQVFAPTAGWDEHVCGARVRGRGAARTDAEGGGGGPGRSALRRGRRACLRGGGEGRLLPLPGRRTDQRAHCVARSLRDEHAGGNPPVLRRPAGGHLHQAQGHLPPALVPRASPVAVRHFCFALDAKGGSVLPQPLPPTLNKSLRVHENELLI
mmetsp:Transcript_1838/g.4596  ORF Transcript_1838/g.4596 Transcript_1838/m.4596 type:complete len:218 (-) Transcript_1838:133-786(-)